MERALARIDGAFPLNLKFGWKIAEITGEIPPIELRSMKLGSFSIDKRKLETVD